MGALSQNRMGKSQTMKEVSLPLDASQNAFIGGMACGDKSTGGVKPGSSATTLIHIGEFASRVDNSTGTTQVQVLVSLDKEIKARWYDNATGANKVLATDLFNDCQVLDDHTVTKASGSLAGRVWAVDTVFGVLVEAYTL